MPWDKERYPPDWDEQAKARKEQAGWICEICGAKQGEIRWGKVNGRYYTVWLAAAHLNHDPENPHAKLAVFCQACHMKSPRLELVADTLSEGTHPYVACRTVIAF